MKRFSKLIIGLGLILTVVSACGITQELDQSLKLLQSAQSFLVDEQKKMKDINEMVESFSFDYNTDVTTNKLETILNNEDSLLNKDYQKQEDFIKSLKQDQKELETYIKDLQKIIDQKAIDVDEEQLITIKGSLIILSHNLDSLQSYLETVIKQEKNLYDDINANTAEAQVSVINRSNGAILQLTEETLSNIDYSINLIVNFENTAPTLNDEGEN